MVFKNFRLQVILRLTLLVGSVLILLVLTQSTRLYMTFVLIGLAIVYQIVGLIHYVEKTNRDTLRFLDAIRYSDFTQTFTSQGMGRSFDQLKRSFNTVMDDFRKARSEKEEHARYLQTVVQHIGIGLLVYDRQFQIQLSNNAFLKLFYQSLHGRTLRHLDDLQAVGVELVNVLKEIRSGDRRLIKMTVDDEWLQLAIRATEFRLRDTSYTLVSIQNIQTELEEREMEAWQNLIRVLTHEIMNSVTPIRSLAATVDQMLTKTLPPMPGETAKDLRDALQTIQNRSDGLIKFVQTYRNLTRLPVPNFRIVRVDDLLRRTENLLKERLERGRIRWRCVIEPQTLEVTADPDLIEQVLINLAINSCQALEATAQPRLEIRARTDAQGRVIIQVSDNGPGIIDEAMQKIFVPFFTTKPNGSGIGLSLSRQIMRLHRGNLTVQSRPDVETIFTLRF